MNQAFAALTADIFSMSAWRLTWFFLCSFTIAKLFFSAKMSKSNKSAHWSFLIFPYLLIYCAFIFEFPLNQYGDFQRCFESNAAQTFIEALCIPLLAFVFRDQAWKALHSFVCFEIVAVWFRIPDFFTAPSFATAFIALSIPFVCNRIRFFGLLTILFHHGSTALVIIAFELLAYGWIKREKLKEYVQEFFAGGIVIVLFLIALIQNKSDLFLGSESRIQVWTRFMCEWAYSWHYALIDPLKIHFRNILIGTGPGSFMWISLIRDHFKTPAFMQLHSDVLQIIFELGLIGFILSFALFFRAVNKVKENAKLLAGLLGTLAFCLTYHPLRYGLSATLIALIFVDSLSYKRR